jgi:hypothetical protein
MDEGLVVRAKDFEGLGLKNSYPQLTEAVRRRAKARVVNRYRFMTPIWQRINKRMNRGVFEDLEESSKY